jgi:phosphate-selective porin OprO/OprP
MRKIGVVLLVLGLSRAVSAAGPDGTLEERVLQLEREVEELKTGAGDGVPLEAYWKNGFRLRSADGAFELRIRGMIQADAAVMIDDDEINEAFAAEAAAAGDGEKPDKLQSGVEFRRTRLALEGRIYEKMEFEITYDFSDSEVEAKDVFLAFLEVPLLGTVRIGHQHEPFSRVQGSSGNRPFMEEGLQDSLAPDRNTGVRFIRGLRDERMVLSAGAYYDTDDTGASVEENAYDLAARVCGLPWEDRESGRLLHLGAAYLYRRPPDDAFDFGARPDAHLAETLIGRSDIPADAGHFSNGEAALVAGPLTAFGEYIQADVDIAAGSNARLDGYSVAAAWLLTGETRGYDREEGKLGGVKPRRNFRDGAGGWGAWEILARVSGLDLNDGAVREGRMIDYTAGLNWYLNPNVKWMFKYVFADADDLGETQIAQSRLQLSF